MASHSRASKNREDPTYDLENLDYGERNEINDLEFEEDDEVEIMGSNPSPSIPNPTTIERKTKSQVWIFFTKTKEENKAICNICKQDFSHKGGGNNTLKRHIINKHPGVWEAGTAATGGPIQSQISASTGTNFGNFLYNKKK